MLFGGHLLIPSLVGCGRGLASLLGRSGREPFVCSPSELEGTGCFGALPLQSPSLSTRT